MEFKLFEKSDFPFMEEILVDDDITFDINNLSRFVDTENAYGFIAKDKEKIVAFAYGYALIRPDNKTMFYLHSIGVLPSFQNKGVGSGLMKYITNFAKTKNFSEVFVITDKQNQPACRIYEKTGYTNEIENEIVYVNEFIKN